MTSPPATLSSLDPEVVIYLGSTTKTVTPALRLGWLAAPRSLVPQLAEAAGQFGGGQAQPPSVRSSP